MYLENYIMGNMHIYILVGIINLFLFMAKNILNVIFSINQKISAYYKVGYSQMKLIK